MIQKMYLMIFAIKKREKVVIILIKFLCKYEFFMKLGIIKIKQIEVSANMIQETHQDYGVLSNQRQDTDNQYKLNQPCTGTQKVYFMSFVCTPKLLEDPSNKTERFSSSLWSNKQIKSIRQLTHHVEISINNKKEAEVTQQKGRNGKKELTQGYNLTNADYQKHLQGIKRTWTQDYPHFKRVIQLKRIDQQKTFDDWVRSMKGKNFIGWYLPLRDDGPKLRKLVISKPSLKMLGYQPEQFNFQFEKYTVVAIDLLGGQAYKACFTNYLNSFTSFMAMELRDQITLEQCVKNSVSFVTNSMKGKNQLSLKVQMKFTMPNAFTVGYEMLRVVQQNQHKDESISNYKNKLMSKVEKTTYNSLSRITKLPREMNPQNTYKICSYQVIRQPQIQYIEQKSPIDPSQSEFVLEDQK